MDQKTRIMIVEDERKTLNGLVTLIQRFGSDYEVCATARSGTDGLDGALQHQPEIIITDVRMPGMDGLEMAGQLWKRGYRGKVIVLSGHSDFEYTRKALQLGIFDYVLKPITPDDLLSVLDRAAKALAAERDKQPSLDEISAMFERLSLLDFEDEQESRRFHAQFQPLNGKEILVPLVLFFRAKLNQHDVALVMEVLRISFSDAINRYTAVTPGLFRIQALMQYAGIEPFCRALDHCMERLAEVAVPVFALYDDRFELPLTRRFADMLPMSRWSLLFGMFCATSTSHIRSLPTQGLAYPQGLERDLLMALNKRESVEKALDAFIYALRASGSHPVHMYESMLRLANAVLSQLKTTNPQLHNEIVQMQVLSGVPRCLTFDQYRNMMMNILGPAVGDPIGKSLKRITTLALGVIQRDYAKDISLESVAGSLSVTPEYLSRRFGVDLGKSFVSCLNEYRIERAKEYLASGKYKVFEIAQMTGFTNPKYFAIVFRKYTSYSPRDYLTAVRE